MLAQAASLLNKKGSTIIPSAQNAASMHMQRKNVFRGDANLYDDMSSVAVQTPYLSSLSDISKSLHKTGSTEARKPQPSIAPRPTKPTSTEKPKESNLKTDVKPEVIKEPPKKAEEPAKEPSEKPVTSDKAGSPDKSGAKGEKSPATPDEDPAFQAVVQQAKSVAERQEIHPKAKTKADEAKDASILPERHRYTTAASVQVGEMDTVTKQPKFDKDGFVKAVNDRMGGIKVNSVDDVDNLKDQLAPARDHMRSEFQKSKQKAEDPIKNATNATIPEAAKEESKELTALVPGRAPQKIQAELAAPKPKAENELSLDEDSKKLDELMTESDITEEQLQNSNEPSFLEAAAAKNGSQAMAREAPALYSEDEEAILDDAKNQILTSAGTSLNSMYNARTTKFKEAFGAQEESKKGHTAEKKKVYDGIERIYKETKGEVMTRLAQLETDVIKFYDWNANDAQNDFEKDVYPIVDRYSGASGAILAIDDWAWGPPKWVQKEFEQGRKDYFKRMEANIIGVARMVETGLKEVNTIIDKGWTAIKEFRDGLEPKEQKIADLAIENIGDKFDTLRQSVGDKFNNLVDLMAQKYRASRKKIDDRLDEIRASMRPVWEKAYAFLKEVAKTIIGLGKLLLQVLVKGVAIVGKIIKDPIGFLGNLIKGVKAGLDNFVGKLGKYLEEGVKDWLSEELGQAGIQWPQSLDFKGILSIVLQVLGLTYGDIRSIAVTKFGEEVVKKLEQTSEIFQILISEGPGGLWKYIQEKLGDLKEMVIDGIKSYLKTTVIEAGIRLILGLLTPASAFIRAAKAIYDIVKFIITRASQVARFVNAVLDSLGAIAEGNITAAASAVEDALAKGVPVVIGFLASILGLDDIGESVRGIILKARARVHKGVEWVLDKAVSMVKSAGGFVKDLFKGKKEEEVASSNDPQHNARVTEGILAIKAEEEKYQTNGKLLHKDAEIIAVKVKSRFPVFKSINVVDGGDNWVYHYVGSSGDVEGKGKAPPPRKVSMPASRHFIRKVTQRTVAKEKNSVIDPSVDVYQDVTDINAGKGNFAKTPEGVDTVTVNGRTYGIKPTGTLYPITGNGIMLLDNGAFKSLGVYNKFGNTSRATEILDMAGYSPEQRSKALEAWRIGGEKTLVTEQSELVNPTVDPTESGKQLGDVEGVDLVRTAPATSPRPPAQTIKASPPPPPATTRVTPKPGGPLAVTDAEVVAANVSKPSAIKPTASQEHQDIWHQVGGSSPTAPPAFRDQNGNIHIRDDHRLLAPATRRVIPPVQLHGGTPPPSQPANVPAQIPAGHDIGFAKTEPPPPTPARPPLGRETGAASPESLQPMAPAPQKKGGRWMPRVPPQAVSDEMVSRLKDRARYTVDHEAHKQAWRLLGGSPDVADADKVPPAFISENVVYLDPSRWPPKTK